MVGAWQSSLLIGQLTRRGQHYIFYNGIADDRSGLLPAPVGSNTGNPCSDPADLVRGIVFCLSLNRRNRLKGGEN